VIPASPAEQRRLYQLQQADTVIHKLVHRRANLPEQKALDDQAATLVKIKSDLVDATERLEELERQQKRHEDEIAAIDARRKSEEGRMYSGAIHNERELGAVREELSVLRSRKNQVEDTLLEVMEEREELETTVATLRERHGELSAAVEELTAARDEAAVEIDAELIQRRAERDEVADDVPEEIRELYDELLRRKDGTAVAALRGDTCDGCHLGLTVIELEEAREQVERGLTKCPQCGRILVLGVE
jgi:uncharacterized protein